MGIVHGSIERVDVPLAAVIPLQLSALNKDVLSKTYERFADSNFDIRLDHIENLLEEDKCGGLTKNNRILASLKEFDNLFLEKFICDREQRKKEDKNLSSDEGQGDPKK